MVTAQQIAEYIVWSCHETGSFVSNLKLQKLLYYVQAWHLAIFQRALFAERFEAWIHGPVIPEIYRKYREHGWRDIDQEGPPPPLDKRTVAFVEEVLEEYGPLDARRLEIMTHREDPWIEARKGVDVDDSCSAPIDEEMMGSYYRERLNEAEIKAMQQEEEEQEAARHEQVLLRGEDIEQG